MSQLYVSLESNLIRQLCSYDPVRFRHQKHIVILKYTKYQVFVVIKGLLENVQ